MKKLGVILILSLMIFAFLNFVIVQAQETPEVSEDTEKIAEFGEKVSDEQTRSEYLKQEWKKILEQSVFGKALLGIDSFLTKISIVFRVLFGEPYSKSLPFLFVVILWILAAVKATEIARGAGIAEKGISYIIGVVFSIILAQIQLFKRISTFIYNLIFMPETWWAKIIVVIIIIFVIVLLYCLGTMLSKSLKEKRKKQKEEKAEETQKEMKNITKGAGI